MIARPSTTDYAPFFDTYVSLVPEDDILPLLRSQLASTLSLVQAIGEERALDLHPPYTWCTKQVLGHLIDCERVFGYRALRFARGDATPLPGFDENLYDTHANFNGVALSDLADEFASLRRSHIHFFNALTPEAWARGGSANGGPVTVLTLAFILVGHERHHTQILRKRFGLGE